MKTRYLMFDVIDKLSPKTGSTVTAVTVPLAVLPEITSVPTKIVIAI